MTFCGTWASAEGGDPRQTIEAQTWIPTPRSNLLVCRRGIEARSQLLGIAARQPELQTGFLLLQLLSRPLQGPGKALNHAREHGSAGLARPALAQGRFSRKRRTAD